MTLRAVLLLLGGLTAPGGSGPSRTIPLTPDAWVATDSLRFDRTWGARRSTSTAASPWRAGHRWRTARWTSTWRPANHELPGRRVPGRLAEVLQRRVPAAGCQRDGGSGPVRTGVQQRRRRLAGLPWRRRQRGRGCSAQPMGARPGGAGRTGGPGVRGHRHGADARRPPSGRVGRRGPGCLGRRVRPRRVLLQHPLHPGARDHPASRPCRRCRRGRSRNGRSRTRSKPPTSPRRRFPISAGSRGSRSKGSRRDSSSSTGIGRRRWAACRATAPAPS